MPALAPVVDSLDKVPETAKTFYVQKDGKYHLDLDGTPAGYAPASELTAANAKVIEFRDNNIALTKKVTELEPLKVKFEGIDPEEAKTAIAKVKELKGKGVDKPDDLVAMVSAAVNAAVKPLQDEINTTKVTAAADRKRADEGTLRQTIGDKFNKSGGKLKALDFILAQAQSVFEVKDGKTVAQPNKYSTARPGEPIDVDEWLTVQAKENDFAFEPSRGSGAPGSGGGSGSVNLKPGQTLLKDPSPKQLGEHAEAISKGTVKVEYSQP